MGKKIEAINYFLDIATLSTISIFGFFLGVKGLLPILFIALITLFSVSVTIHLENKRV